MDKVLGITLTLISGIFFLVGGLIFLKVKNKEKLESFSVAVALIIMLNLIFVDLGPEIIELLDSTGKVKSLVIIISLIRFKLIYLYPILTYKPYLNLIDLLILIFVMMH